MGAEDPSRGSRPASLRLNSYLARAGVASRRAADQLIASGAVRVNGERPPATGALVDPEHDRITVQGRIVKPVAEHRYVLLNKPLGAITTARDEASRTTVLDVIGKEGTHGHRLFPVGRLDGDSTGLLLMTDDGDLAYRLTHPRYKVAKEYEVTVVGVPSEADLGTLRRGVKLEDGVTAPADVRLLRAPRGDRDSGGAELRVTISEGRNRQVRRMLQAVGNRVVALRRTGFGPLRAGRLKPGEWRVLTAGEVSALRRAVGL
jgi:pseudouridine synthase